MTALARFARRLSRDAGVYGAGFGVTLVLSLASVAVLTRFLSPREFGELAVLLVFSGLLSVLYNVGLLQGGLAWVFGASGEEGGDESDGAGTAADKRTALGTAIVVTAAVAALGTGIAIAAVGGFETLLGLPGATAEVATAAASGGLGALWRLLSNVPRLERRPRVYVALSAARPVLVLGVSVPLVASGAGALGAIAGVAGGTALAVGLGLIALRRSYRLSLSVRDVGRMVALGAPFVPVVVAFWVIQNVDIYVLSRFADEDDVGLYRLASRVAAIVSYFVSAFLMAWGPLTASSTFMAAARDRGAVAVGGQLVAYYTAVALFLLVALSIGADALVRIAPPSYAGAAGLIPLLGAGFVVYGGFIVLYRAARFPRRRRAYGVLAVASAATFVPVAIVLTSALGSYGAALAPVVTFAAGCAGMAWVSQRGPDPIPFEPARLLGPALIAAGCVALARGGGALGLTGGLRLAVDAVALAAYPGLVVALGIVPRGHLRSLARVLSPGRGDVTAVGERLAALDPGDRRLVLDVVVEGEDVEVAARRHGMAGDDPHRRLLGALADVAGSPRAVEDPLALELIDTQLSVAERDGIARRLWERGADPHALDLLEEACDRIRAFARRRSTAAV